MKRWASITSRMRVELTLDDAPWFERLDEATKTIELGPREVRSARFRIRARKAARHELVVRGVGRPLPRAEGRPEEAADGENVPRAVADAVRRSVEVAPEGRRVERVQSGVLREPVEAALAVPARSEPR